MTKDELQLTADLAEAWLSELPTDTMQSDAGLIVRPDFNEPGEIRVSERFEEGCAVLWLRQDGDHWTVVAWAGNEDDPDMTWPSEVRVSAGRVGYIR